MTRSHRSAFTLIELMLVVVLLGVVAAIAAPRVAALVPRIALQEAARQVADDARAAQACAADCGHAVSLVYDLDAGTIRIASAGAPALDPLPAGVSMARVASSTSGAVRVAVFPSGYVAPHTVELRSETAGEMTIDFSGLGVQVR